MATENALVFLRALAGRKGPPSAAAMAGPQAFVREYILDRLRARSAQDGFQYRSHQIGAGLAAEGLLNELENADLFAPKRLVACRLLRSYRERASDLDEDDARPTGASGEIEARLVAALERPNPALRLVIICERDTAPAKIRRAAEAHGVLVNCARPFDNQLPQYAELFARDSGLKLSVGATDLLISRHGGDLGAVANAIARAAITCGDAQMLEAADFGASGAPRLPELFELADAIARGATNEALALLGRAIQTGRDPIEMLAVEIIPLVRRMLAAASLLADRRSPLAITGALGLPPNSTMASRAIEGARLLGLDRLQRAHHQACALDEQFKMGLRKDRETGITGLLLDLMAH